MSNVPLNFAGPCASAVWRPGPSTFFVTDEARCAGPPRIVSRWFLDAGVHGRRSDVTADTNVRSVAGQPRGQVVASTNNSAATRRQQTAAAAGNCRTGESSFPQRSDSCRKQRDGQQLGVPLQWFAWHPKSVKGVRAGWETLRLRRRGRRLVCLSAVVVAAKATQSVGIVPLA